MNEKPTETREKCESGESCPDCSCGKEDNQPADQPSLWALVITLVMIIAIATGINLLLKAKTGAGNKDFDRGHSRDTISTAE